MAQTRRNVAQPKSGHYLIKQELFWSALLGISIPLLTGMFFLGQFIGNTKYDISTNEVRESNMLLKDSIALRDRSIERMRFVSDSALNILGHMPYEQMRLDTLEFHKVQSNIEAAGAALYLNINYKK